MNELEPEPRSWWSKNWKWVVPVSGCFTIIVLGILLLGTAIFGFFSSTKSNYDADELFTMAQTNPQIIKALGEPIQKYDQVLSKILYENGSKSYSVQLPLKGSKSTGILKFKSAGSGEDTTIEIFEIQVEETGELIDLKDSVENTDF